MHRPPKHLGGSGTARARGAGLVLMMLLCVYSFLFLASPALACPPHQLVWVDEEWSYSNFVTKGCITYATLKIRTYWACADCPWKGWGGWDNRGTVVYSTNHSFTTVGSPQSSTSGCATTTWTHYTKKCTKCGLIDSEWDSSKTTTYNHIWALTTTYDYTTSQVSPCVTNVYQIPVTTKTCSRCGANGGTTRGSPTFVGTQESHMWVETGRNTQTTTRQSGCTIYAQDWYQVVQQCERCGKTNTTGWIKSGSEYISGYSHNMVAGTPYSDVQEIRPVSGCRWTINTYTCTPHYCSRCGLPGTTTRSLASTTYEYRHTWENSWGDTLVSYELRGCQKWGIEQKALYCTCSVCGAFEDKGYQKTNEWFTGEYQHDFSVRVSSTPREGPKMPVSSNPCELMYQTWDEVTYKCSRCSATTTKNENYQTHYEDHHSLIPWNTEYDGPRQVQQGCSVYDVYYQRTVYQCQNCGAETYGPWVETSRTFVRASHDFSVKLSENKEPLGLPQQHLCEIAVPYKTVTTWKCSRCSETKTTEVTGTDYFYDHLWGEPYEEPKSEDTPDGLWRIYYVQLVRTCSRCGWTEELSPWVEKTRVPLQTSAKPDGEYLGNGEYYACWFLKTMQKWIVFYAGNSHTLDVQWPPTVYIRTPLDPPEAINLLYINNITPTINPQYNNDGTWYLMEPRNTNKKPVAQFTATSPVSVGHEVKYTDTSYDEDGWIVARQWTDQQSSYSAPGDYKVYLVVQDNAGEWSDMASFTIHVVANQPPIADFDCPATVQVGQTVTYVDKSSDPDGDRIVSRVWTGNLAKFTTAGTYTVSLKVQDEHGAWSSLCTRTIEVKPASPNNPPSVMINPNPPIVYVGQQVSYTVTATDPDPDDQGLLTLSPDPSQLPTVFYAEGDKTVSITVTDPHGASATASCTVTVIAAPQPPTPPPPPPDGNNHKPVARFTVSTPVYAGSPVTYHDQSYDPDPGDYITKWKWTNNQAVFATPGTYQVTLVVTDSHGLDSDPCTLNIQVLAPTVTVTPEQTLVDGERGGLVTITAATTGSVDRVVLELPLGFTRKVTLGDGTILDYNPTGQVQMTLIGPNRWEGKFCIPWTQTQPPDGDYTVVVRAYAGGASATGTVTVRVNGFVQIYVPITK